MHPWGTLGADSKYLKYSLTELLTVPSLAPAPHSTGIYPKSLFLGKTHILNDLTYFFQVFGGSVHQKVSKDLETAVNLGWTAAKNETR